MRRRTVGELSALGQIAVLVVGVAIICAVSLLVSLSRREQRARDDIARHREMAEAQIEEAGRLADIDRVLEDSSCAIDPAREPTLHRIFLLRSGQMPPEQYAAEADREALLERVVADLDELRATYARDGAGLRAAWRRRFGREPAPGEIERLIIRDAGEPVA
jgi:hypothetical protein